MNVPDFSDKFCTEEQKVKIFSSEGSIVFYIIMLQYILKTLIIGALLSAYEYNHYRYGQRVELKDMRSLIMIIVDISKLQEILMLVDDQF